ncbi:MAG: efflux RND transporter periplasmic adaptor subunit [Caulobacterales bacterium]
MATARRYGFAAVLVVVLALMGATATVKAVGKAINQDDKKGGEAAPVSVAQPKARNFYDVVQAVGTAEANESVTLSSKVTDVVREIPFESGSRVQKGEVLVRLAAVEEAADLAQTRAAYVEADRAYKRYFELAKKGFAPRAMLDQAEATRDKARADVDASAARLSDHVIRAPFSGVVGLRKASPGLLATPGMELATLDDTTRLKLDFQVPETAFARIKIGDKFDALSGAFPGETFEGEIAEIDTRVSTATRSVMVRAYIPNKDGRLKPGMLMNVRLSLGGRENLAISEQALVENMDSVNVFVIRDDGKGPVAIPVTVNVGYRGEGVAEITQGLSANDNVVVDGLSRVRPKGKVLVVDTKSAAIEPPLKGRAE